MIGKLERRLGENGEVVFVALKEFEGLSTAALRKYTLLRIK